MIDDEKDKRQGSSGSGKSPTKFMERPGTKKPEKKEQEQSHPEFVNDDLDALENQEGDTEYEGWKPPPKPKGDEKPNPRKFPETDKRDSSSGDTGDCACP